MAENTGPAVSRGYVSLIFFLKTCASETLNQYHSLDKKRAIELEKQNANQKEMDFGEFLFYLDEFLKFLKFSV